MFEEYWAGNARQREEKDEEERDDWGERNRKQKEKAEKGREEKKMEGVGVGGAKKESQTPLYSGLRRKDTGFPRDRIFCPSF